MVETMHLHAVITADGRLTVDVPSKLPPGPADVVLVIVPIPSASSHTARWRDFYGVGKELWGDQDAQEYVNRLREEWN